MRRFLFLLLVAVATATIAACSGGATTAPAATSATNPSSAASAAAGGSAAAAAKCATAPAGSAATVNVTIKGFAFSPQPVQAKVGDVVAWKNEDSAPHSATMDDNACDTDTINSGATAMLVFNAPGTYTYHCKVHPTQMKDVTVVVQ